MEQKDRIDIMPDAMQKVIELKGIGMQWNGKRVLSDVNLTVNRGDFMAITGPNGGGKTTLLRIMLKLLTPTAGRVIYRNLAGGECNKLPIGYLPQKNMIDSRFPISVSEVISSGMMGMGHLPASERHESLIGMLETVELTSHRNASIGDLSGGQLQRALLGRALISRPEVLVLDEPLSYLDKHFEHHIYKILERVAPHTTVVLVSHELSVISTMANRHVIVDNTVHLCHGRHPLPMREDSACE